MLIFIAVCLLGVGLGITLSSLNQRLSNIEESLERITGEQEISIDMKLSQNDIKKITNICLDEINKREKVSVEDIKKIVRIADSLLPTDITDALAVFPTEEEYYKTIYENFNKEK